MVELNVKLSDEPTVFLSSVRKMLNDLGGVILDYNKDEKYLMELADLYERVLEYQDVQSIPASDFFDASEIDKIMRFMFSNDKLEESLKECLCSVSFVFYWKYYNIASWDNRDQNIINQSV